MDKPVINYGHSVALDYSHEPDEQLAAIIRGFKIRWMVKEKAERYGPNRVFLGKEELGRTLAFWALTLRDTEKQFGESRTRLIFRSARLEIQKRDKARSKLKQAGKNFRMTDSTEIVRRQA
jgi:hypothetical protein